MSFLNLWTHVAAPPPPSTEPPVAPGYAERNYDDGTYKGIMTPDGETREGGGTMVYNDGSVYRGSWAGDKFEGVGRLDSANGDSYSGSFTDGDSHGEGEMIFGEEGQAKPTEREPTEREPTEREPTEREPTERNALTRYKGGFVRGRISGAGKGTFVDGFKYEGEFVNGFAHGQGLLTYPNSAGCVEGTFKNGDLVQGIETLRSGERYEGKFGGGGRNTKTGDGICSYPADGSTFEGSFKSGKRNGFGRFVDGKTRVKYSGKWVGGKRQGNGTETFPKGSKFVGLYGDDEKVEGCYTTAEGEVYEGRWTDIKEKLDMNVNTNMKSQ